MKCRCGRNAARVCGVCCEQPNASGACSRHPDAPLVPVLCHTCRRPLDFWHFAVNLDGELVCLPSCAHALDGSEWRPEVAA